MVYQSPMYELSGEHVRFFEDFGYLVLPGRLADQLAWIEEEFEAVFADHGAAADGSGPRHIVPFVDQREKLSTLLEHPSTLAIADALLGPEWNYLAGDGNLYAGETPWHRDGVWQHLRFIKIAMYLDPVGADSGALRVIPGSHRTHAPLDEVWLLGLDPAKYGMEARDMPSATLTSSPGDVVVFSHGLFHASFGGGNRRRMFTLNMSRRASTPEELADLRAYIALNVNAGHERMQTELFRSAASPERMQHMQQVIDNEGLLTSLARERRAQPGVSGMV